MGEAELKCNGCTACCRCGWVVLNPALGDNPSQYEYETRDVGTVLKRKPNGDCIYLNESGCSIYEKRPSVCRAFDCRVYARSDWGKKDPNANAEVMQAGLSRELWEVDTFDYPQMKNPISWKI